MMPKKNRKADVLAKPGSTADYLKRIRKWKEGGMRGPKPKKPKKGVSVGNLF